MKIVEPYFDFEGEYWECEYCHNGDYSQEYKEDEEENDEDDICPDCGEKLDDDYYYCNCGWPTNQGWIGENYG